ncbi:fluoride efflux transporter CrcB [Methylococcus sp. EFPC2]|nr:fluoride efflux transporter CrcB [Methylococcus sp. EFPC2]
MNQLLAIAAGGSAGALARYWVANGVYAWLGRDFPYGTLLVNVSGCLLMGLLSELATQRFALSGEFRAAVLIGFLGAYTTFSTFALETLNLFEQGSFFKVLLNVTLSVLLCLAAVWLGAVVGRRLFAGGLGLTLEAGISWPWAAAGVALAFLAGLWLGRQI